MRLLLSVFIVFILFASCSKESSKPNASPLRSDIIVNKKWKTVVVSAKLVDGSIEVDDISKWEEHRKDNYYLFNSDLTFTLQANSVKRPGDTREILESGTWKLINNDSYLELKPGVQQPGQTINYFPTKILSLNATEMKWEVYDDTGQIIWLTFQSIP